MTITPILLYINLIMSQFIFVGHNSTDNKLNQNDLLPNNLVFVYDNSVTATPELFEYCFVSKIQSWDNFWTAFKKAVKQKNRKELLDLSDPDDSFNEEIGASAKEFSQRKRIDQSSWNIMRKAISTGIRNVGENKKTTKDEVLVFVYKKSNWYWYGIISD